MAVADAMFIFEVVVEHVKSMVESRLLVIRSEFADIFSLELKDPKQMHIVIPEPPPLPPEPPGKGKKKKPPKKPKKGKKGALPPPAPPEPVIQSGQSVLFTSSAEFLIKLMHKYPLQVTLWSKEDNLTYIGSSVIPWDPIFVTYLEQILRCQTPPSVTLNDEFNAFEENTGKLMAKIGLQIKLSHLGEKVTTSFRTLSEDLAVRKYLYTGINSKRTSYICTMRTTDEVFEENCNKIENSFIKDIAKPIRFADYKNASGTNLVEFTEGDYCCMNNADKPPHSKYTAPNTVPSIDFIIDYVRKIVASCNDNMRMLTPRPTIKPTIRATDIDRLCYCNQSNWPDSALAQQYKKEVQGGPCAVCAEQGNKKKEEGPGSIFDLANLRGPCGKPDCKIAMQIRSYIKSLIEEDNIEINITDIIGPCGSELCTLAERIQEFLRHEGVFSLGDTKEGLSTQCACIQKMQAALMRSKSCHSICSKNCEEADNDPEDSCGGKGCPFSGPSQPLVYNVYYFTVEYGDPIQSGSTSQNTSHRTSHNTSLNTSRKSSLMSSDVNSKFQHCANDCPSMKASTEVTSCTKSVCSSAKTAEKPCPENSCPVKGEFAPSPADSDIEIQFDEIHNPCCSTTCDVTETLKNFIVDGLESKQKHSGNDNDPCYCDCECDFKFTKNTTYCAVCGGYECLGTDMKKQPDYIKPLPCPIYHKLYDKKYIVTASPWPDDDKIQPDMLSVKSSKVKKSTSVGVKKVSSSLYDAASEKNEKEKTTKEKLKHARKSSTVVKKGVYKKQGEQRQVVEKKPFKYPYPPVPANKGWNWTAEDIPGMKPRPNWKPGAAIKPLVRRYRALREGINTIAKKKRALMQKKKKVEPKPLLLVKKIDGEYTVEMQVFKNFSKERLLNQYPFEEKAPLTYTIGKTEEEKRKIQKQRERRERRETRRKSRLLQSTFRDKCQEICVKAYNQAIGVLPLPNPNDPNCPCNTLPADAISPPIDSCSCSEEDSISTSDTDGDDWIIEFSPPAAKYDAKAKPPHIMTDNTTHYTYLDYKVKVLDKQGNQVPRYFIGPDGKQECSDLGGFWGPDKVWLEINRDGFIGADGRWIPLNFIGPDGAAYSSKEGTFTDAEGKTYRLGIDGYVDKDGKWVNYKIKAKQNKSKSTVTGGAKDKAITGITQQTRTEAKTGTKHPKDSGKDAKANKKDQGVSIAKPPGPGKDRIKRTSSVKVSSNRNKDRVVLSMSANFDKPADRRFRKNAGRQSQSPNRISSIEQRKLARYQEIMSGLSTYADIGVLEKPIKTNRACNTPKKQLSPYGSYIESHKYKSQVPHTCSFLESVTIGSSKCKNQQQPSYALSECND